MISELILGDFKIFMQFCRSKLPEVGSYVTLFWLQSIAPTREICINKASFGMMAAICLVAARTLPPICSVAKKGTVLRPLSAHVLDIIKPVKSLE